MINLYDIVRVANGQLFGEPKANLFTDFCFDARQARSNELFVATRTDRGDTHPYIAEAVERGATGVLCMEPPTMDLDGVSVLLVRDTMEALMLWSHYTLRKLGVESIVVLGSAGKSTTVDAIAHLLSTRYKVLRGDLTTAGKSSIPRSLAQLTPEHDYVVFRLDTVYPGEIRTMVEATEPRIAVINQLDCVHPPTFVNCEQYMAEFGLLLSFLSPGGLAVLNYDDEATPDLRAKLHEGVIVQTVGIERFGADVLALNVKAGLERVGFDLRFGSERFVGRWSPVLGRHQLYGVLAALAVADYLGIPLNDALRASVELRALPGRMSALQGRGGSILVDDSYSATFSATMAALEWLAEGQYEDGQRRIFVLGDMNQSGSSHAGYRKVGQRAAEVADLIITQGTQAAQAARAALDQGMSPQNVLTSYSTHDTIALLERLELSERDVVLVKGGAASAMERVVEALLAQEADRAHLARGRGERVQEVNSHTHPSWVEVDSALLAQNVRVIKQLVGNDVELMAVVKSDGYGHGAVRVARTAVMNGAQYLAVASISEAIELRNAGIDTPILVLSYLPVDAIPQAMHLDITVSLFDLELARQYDQLARSFTGRLKAHVNLDTGMGRLGMFADDALPFLRRVQVLQNLELEGVYTHFAVADEDPEFTDAQVMAFKRALRTVREELGLSFRYVHAANSPGTLLHRDHFFNMVRPGLLLYGMKPSSLTPVPEGVEPLMSWKTTVLQVKDFPPGYPVGYGNTYYTKEQERIAVLPVGYADGLRRAPQTWQYVLIRGQRAPLVGRVSMEKCTINVTHIPGVSVGDEVVLLGRQGSEQISAELVAEWLGTINYEVVTTILPRVPRM